ncbi:MAG: ImmA/IrrE family metallo-endopeptidase [Armatimonadota bacterium]
MKIKVIKTEEEYNEALKLVDILMSNDPDPESEDGEKLALLATLIQEYESKVFPESLPDPIDAILFRMEQQNLKPKDLIPYLGNRSKVSEVLSRKRPLTLSMIRALEAGFGIPAKVLLQESDQFLDSNSIAWERFPIKELQKRGYLPAVHDIKSAMEDFFRPIGSPMQFSGMLHKSNYRTTRPMDKQALVTWSALIIKKANEVGHLDTYKPGTVDLDFMQKLSKLSVDEKGPILVRDVLRENGIKLVVEPHFPQTYLDGATILTDKDHPIIGLTLRYDRLDNFWFTLMHELAHISLHYNENFNFFYDDLDNPDITNNQEQDADNMAREALIPESKWVNSPARLIPSSIAAESLANELGIHPAIVAGKMRREGNNYAYLNAIINQAKVHHHFPEETWSK